MSEGVDFAQIEGDYVRKRVYPDFRWRAYDDYSPLNPLRIPLAQARVAFVTTAGVHRLDDTPFDDDSKTGDPSFRSFPVDGVFADLRLTHSGFDTGRAAADLNVVLPLDHLRAAVTEGQIGGLTPTVYSFMGYVAETDPLVDGTAPEVARRLVEDGADLVVLAPT